MRSAQEHAKRLKTGRFALALTGLLLVTLLVACGPGGHPGAPSENGIQPKVIDARATCARVDEDLLELKLEPAPPESGVYPFPDGVNSITIETDGTHFGWESTLGIDGVIVKGGEQANGYQYAAAQEDHADEWFQDNLLHAPLDGPHGDPYEISDILFCYDLKEEDMGRIVVAKESTEPELNDDFDFHASATLGSFTLEPGEQRVFNGVPAGATYQFSETVSTGWSLVGIVCVETGEAETRDDVSAIKERGSTVYLDDGEEIICTFTNEPQTGQLMVIKELVPDDDPGLFDLEIDEKVEKEDASGGDATPLMEVVVGEHTVGESAGTDTDLENYDTEYRCVKKANLDDLQLTNGTGDVLNTVFADPGDVITCTITNTRKTGEVTIEKYTDPEGASDKFPFETTADPASFSLGGGESKLFEDLPVGETATFTETVPAGWELASIRCSENSKGHVAVDDTAVRIDPIPDESITCTFYDDAIPEIEVEKTADPISIVEPGGKVKYSVKVTNVGKTGPVELTALTDDIYGDLTSGTNISITNSTCALEVTIETGTPYQCSFEAMVEAEAGDSVTDEVAAKVEDEGEDEAEASDDASVKIVFQPPDTGAGLPVTTAAGALATAGLALAAAGAALRRRSRRS